MVALANSEADADKPGSKRIGREAPSLLPLYCILDSPAFAVDRRRPSKVKSWGLAVCLAGVSVMSTLGVVGTSQEVQRRVRYGFR